MNSNGSSMIMILVALAVISMLSLSVWPVFSSQTREAERINLSISLGVLQSNFGSIIKNNAAWTATVNSNNNPHLRCLRTTPVVDCATTLSDLNAEYPISVLFDSNFDAANPTAPEAIFFDSTDTRAGLTPTGEKCTGFSATSGNRNCSIRPTMSFRVICAGAPCVNPPVEVIVRFAYSSSQGIPFNTQRFELKERR